MSRLHQRLTRLEESAGDARAPTPVVRIFRADGSRSGPADEELADREAAGEALRVIDVQIVNEPRS